MNLAQISEYLKKQGFDPDAIEPIPPEPDLLPDILDKLNDIFNTLNSISIPQPINFKPDINQSSKKIVDSVKSITIPEPLDNSKDFKNIINALTEISQLLSDKSSLLSVAESVNTFNQDNNSIGQKIITQLELTKSEIQSNNKVTGTSIDTLKSIISTLKSMDTSKILKEVVKSVSKQDNTNKLIVKSMDAIMKKALRSRDYNFDIVRDENGFIRKVVATEIQS